MRPDTEIRHDIEEILDWDPQVGTLDIAVSVRDGVVMLAGFVHSFGDRAQAEANAKRVEGVIAIANDIEVRLPLVGRKPDPEIARQVVSALQREMPASAEQIRVRVADGRVTLEGNVTSHRERKRAEEVACETRSIKSFRNDIIVLPPVLPVEIKSRIEATFRRNAEIEASSICVDIADNGTVVLTGSVSSFAEREEAERTAWSTPGVKQVDNRIGLPV